MIEKINRLKKEKNALVLAHNYQRPEIQDLADFSGDSLELARKSASIQDCGIVVFCGVRFMAETAKILSPGKKILMPEPAAGCPLADMAKPEDVQKMKEAYPEAWVVSYVNTSAEVKALTDVCCTSSNAEKVVRNVPADTIIFLPDQNLGSYVQKRVPEKRLILWEGFCYVHHKFTVSDIEQSRAAYPEAEIMVHPECRPEVQELADGIYSTSGMLHRAKRSDACKIIVGTEMGLVHRLRKENPGKEFYCLGSARACVNMKKITLEKVLASLEEERYEITLSDEIMAKALKSLERMIQYV